MNRAASGALIVVMLGLVLAMVGTWSWHANVFHTRKIELPNDPWEHVKGSYPLAEAPAELVPLSPETARAIVQANPFSPERRRVPVPIEQGAGDGTAAGPEQPHKPQFAYKGRINVGKRQRAIVEDTASHKTHFLEVGQEVAGFKVLDITESQVILSDPQTNEPIVLSLSSAAKPAAHQEGTAPAAVSHPAPGGESP